jgi:hypothetical protein
MAECNVATYNIQVAERLGEKPRTSIDAMSNSVSLYRKASNGFKSVHNATSVSILKCGALTTVACVQVRYRSISPHHEMGIFVAAATHRSQSL